jgi:RNA polymerase sigma-32 factor
MSKRNSTALVPAGASSAAMALPAVGNLDAYIAAVNRLPMLSPERETELGRRIRDNTDLEAAREMVMSHLRLVVSISRQYLGYGLPQADLIQEGNVGLMKAVKRFDPERGVRLVSFAIHWIKAEIHEYILKNWRLVKVATTKAQRKLFFNLRSSRARAARCSARRVWPRWPSVLNVKESDVVEMETRLRPGHGARGRADDGEERWPPSPTWPTATPSPTDVLARPRPPGCSPKASPPRWPRWMRAAAASSSRAG